MIDEVPLTSTKLQAVAIRGAWAPRSELQVERDRVAPDRDGDVFGKGDEIVVYALPGAR